MPDLYIPATAEKQRERDNEAAAPPALLPAHRSRRDYRSSRLLSGRVPAFFEDGPLAGKLFEMEPGRKRVTMPVIVNANERATAHLAGQPVPLPMVLHFRYRKRPGRTPDGALRYVRE